MPGRENAGVSIVTDTSAVPTAGTGSGHAHAPRERVNAASVVNPRSIVRLHTITCGRPSKRCHTGGFALMLSVEYRPQSMPANTWFGMFGLAMTVLAGM